MPTVNDIISEISELFKHQKIEILSGAGVSYNSGIPMAIPIVKYILYKLGLPDEEAKIVLGSSYPFEAFMEMVIGQSQKAEIENFIRIFKIGTPNKNHILFSKLCKAHSLKKIFTTNFDTHFEQALLEEKLDFNVRKNVDDLSQKFDPLKTEVVKLHGCVTEPKSLAIILRQVTKKSITENRRTATEMAFKKTDVEALLIMGYSFSDKFDIMPVVRDMQSDRKVLYIVEHQFDNKEEVISITHGEGYIDKFKGFKILINTDVFVERLGALLLNESFDLSDDHSPDFNEWKVLLDQWANSFLNSPANNCYLLGKILTAIGQHSLAEKWFKEGTNKTSPAENELLFGQLNQALAINYRNRANYEKSIQYGRIALSIAEKRNDADGIIKCKVAIADCLKNLNNLHEALELAQSAVVTSIQKNVNHAGSLAMNCVGMIYLEMGGFDKAIEFFEKAYTISEAIGDIEMAANYLGNIAQARKRKGDYDEAAKLYKQVIEIAEQLGNLKLLSTNYMNLAAISEPEEALRLQTANLDVSKKMGDPYFIGRANYNLAALHFNNADEEIGKIYANGAYKLLKPILNSSNQIITNLEGMLGIT